MSDLSERDGWDSDENLALVFLKRRWEREIEDLIEGSQGEALAFDDLALDFDLEELGNAVSTERLKKLAKKGLERGDAFVRLMAANLAFVYRTDELLEALVASVANGPAPRLQARDLGGLLARARSARRARELVQPLPEPLRAPALEAIEPMIVPGDWSALHVRSTTEELGEATTRVLAKRELVSVPWIRSGDGARYVATRRRGGWVTLLAEKGVDRELASELSMILGPVAWAEKKGDDAVCVRFERKRAVEEATGLDEVGGALRALGITAHDTKAPGKVVTLGWTDYVPPGETSPARLRKMSALGLAFLPPDLARKANSFKKRH